MVFVSHGWDFAHCTEDIFPEPRQRCKPLHVLRLRSLRTNIANFWQFFLHCFISNPLLVWVNPYCSTSMTTNIMILSVELWNLHSLFSKKSSIIFKTKYKSFSHKIIWKRHHQHCYLNKKMKKQFGIMNISEVVIEMCCKIVLIKVSIEHSKISQNVTKVVKILAQVSV